MMLANPMLEACLRLVPARVQKATVDPVVGLILELYAPRLIGEPVGEPVRETVGGPRGEPVGAGAKRWLVIRDGHVAVQEEKPPPRALDGPPPPTQGLLRKEAVPSTLIAVDVLTAGFDTAGFDSAGFDSATAPDAPHLVRLVLTRPQGQARVLILERTAEPRTLLCAEADAGLRVLGLLEGSARTGDGRDLRRGRVYEAPRKPRPPNPVATRAVASAQDGNEALAARTQLAGLRARLRAEAKRLKRLRDALEADLARHGDAARHEEDGELLKTALGRVRRGMTVIDVHDWCGAPRTVALDALLDGRGNLELLFKRARRAREAAARARPRLVEVQTRLAALEELRGALGAAAPTSGALDDARAFLARHDTGGSPRRRAATAGPRRPWRAFRLANDVVARVGRGAQDNDALVRSARGNDLWLHARGQQGAHVVVPSGGGDIDPAVLLDAAQLAAHFSSARGEMHVDVQTSRVKHLRKPGPGAPAGMVHVTHETVVPLRVDAQRIKQLLAAEVAA